MHHKVCVYSHTCIIHSIIQFFQNIQTTRCVFPGNLCAAEAGFHGDRVVHSSHPLHASAGSCLPSVVMALRCFSRPLWVTCSAPPSCCPLKPYEDHSRCNHSHDYDMNEENWFNIACTKDYILRILWKCTIFLILKKKRFKRFFYSLFLLKKINICALVT